MGGLLGQPPTSARLRALLEAQHGVVGPRVLDPGRACGEEMLVVTNPTTRPAAGMRTTGVEIGASAGLIGTTATAIASYVTSTGGDDPVPIFPGVNGIPSDLPYAMRDEADELPDVMSETPAGSGIAFSRLQLGEQREVLNVARPSGGSLHSDQVIDGRDRDRHTPDLRSERALA